jgi:hypothetical protein
MRFRSGLWRLSAGKVAPAFAHFGERFVVLSLSRFSRSGPSFPKSVAFLTPILSLLKFPGSTKDSLWLIGFWRFLCQPPRLAYRCAPAK